MIRYTHEKFEDVIEELQPMLHQHWNEIPTLDFDIKLAPQYEIYQLSQDNDQLVIITAREDQTNKLQGYIVVFIQEPLHHRSVKEANVDIVFLAPECRGKGVGKLLFIETENYLKEYYGVNQIRVEVNEHLDFSPLLIKREYRKSHTVYMKEIK